MSKPGLQEVCKWERVSNTPYLYAHEPISLYEGKSRVHVAKTDQQENLYQPLAIKFFTNFQKPNNIISELIGLKMSHVVNFYDVNFQTPSFVVMELCKQNLKQGRFLKQFYHSGEETLKLAQHLLDGLKELKIHRVIHCDVKPQNVVCSKMGLFKFCDIDFSLTEKEAIQSKIRVGTFEYMAPQILEKGSCSYQSDIWSLGILLYEVFFGHFPWHKPRLCQRFSSEQFLKYRKAIKRELETVREGISMRLQQAEEKETVILFQLLLACLVFDPFERRDIEDLCCLASRDKTRKSSLSYLIQSNDNQQQLLKQSTKLSLSKQLHHLQQDFSNLPANDLLLRKANNLVSLINSFCQVLTNEEATLCMFDSSKMMAESKRISDIIRNNIKRLGPSTTTGLTQQKKNLADHLQALSTYLLNLNLKQQKAILPASNRSSDQLPKK